MNIKKIIVSGSTVDREASDKEKAKDCPTFKENSFFIYKNSLLLNSGLYIIYNFTSPAHRPHSPFYDFYNFTQENLTILSDKGMFRNKIIPPVLWK